MQKLLPNLMSISLQKKNIVYDQHMFFTRNQKEGEKNIEEYVKELRLLAAVCELGKLVDTLVRG